MATNINSDIQKLKRELSLNVGDVIYVVSHKKQKSALGHILDFITGGTVDLIHSYQGGAYRYLVATDNTGVIYDISTDSRLVKVADVSEWSTVQKNNFKSVVIDDIKYKTIRKVSVN